MLGNRATTTEGQKPHDEMARRQWRRIRGVRASEWERRRSSCVVVLLVRTFPYEHNGKRHACCVGRGGEWRGGRRLTDHGGFDEAPGVALRHVGLQDPRRAAGLVHSSEHVDLPPAHRGGRRVDRLGEGGDRLPLVGDGVVPGGGKKINKIKEALSQIFCTRTATSNPGGF